MTRTARASRAGRGTAVALAAAVTAVLLLVPAAPAAAHPLGNFTANTAAAVTVTPDAVRVDYVLDLAEIPALQTVQRIDADGDREVSDREGAAYRAEECAAIAEGLTVAVAGRRAPVAVTGSALAFPPGQAGLDTLRLECALTATVDVGGSSDRVDVTVDDATRRDRVGWREVTAVGDGVDLTAADVPAVSSTDRLTSYPQDRLQSPLRVTSAALTVEPGDRGAGPGSTVGGATAEDPPGGGVVATLDRLTDTFTGLVSRQELTGGFVLLASVLAVGLGALHALAPGHGKTVMAAYVVGQRGATRHAVGLGLAVAVAHTAGVLALGLVLTLTQAVTPERLYPALGVASGLLFAAVGAVLLTRALRRPHGGHGHGHGHDHGHGHGHHDRGRGGGSGRAPSWRGLVLPGLAGGMVPTPSALVVLLGGIALGRAWLGVGLVVAYGIGMAGTLVGGGWVLARLRERIEGRVLAAGRAGGAGARLGERIVAGLPVTAAALVLVGGLVLTARAALAA